MSFKLVYYSQQDPQWKADLLGFGDPGDTIGFVGCALTSVAMLVSGHGYTETPQTLNQKLKSKNGFVSSGIRWDVVAQVHPQITLRESVNCEITDAPLARINASLDAGQPVVVRVDSSPAPGLQWHYVMLYARKGDNDYLMLDPYPYQPGTAKEDLLMARYSRGNPLKRAIQQVLFYQCSTASGTTGTPQPQPTTDTVSGARVRVKAELTWGLNVRSSTDTSSMANVVASVSAGTELILLDADGASKIGTQQWVRVREPGGKEGFAAAWYLDLVSSGAPAPSTGSTPGPVSEPPASTPAPTPSPTNPAPASTPTPAPSTPSQPMDPNKKYLVVSDTALELRQKASNSAPSQMHLTPGMLLIVIEPYAKAKGKLSLQNQWIYVRGPNKKLGYVLSQFVKLP